MKHPTNRLTTTSACRTIKLITVAMRLLLCLPLLILFNLSVFAQAGANDASFNIGLGFAAPVSALAIQPDDKIVVGGSLSSFNNVNVSKLVRLNSTGTLDNSFSASVDNAVYEAVLQPDGKIIIAGDFTSVNGVSRNKIARLNTDGSLDMSFNPGSGFNNQVLSITIDPLGRIICGGRFTTFNGVSRPYIARLNMDGSNDPSFIVGIGPNNYVLSTALQADGKILVAGDFNLYNGVKHTYVARLTTDGLPDNSFVLAEDVSGIPLNNSVHSVITETGGSILIAGAFTFYNGTSRNQIARLTSTGALDLSFNPGSGFSGGVTLKLHKQPDGKILAAGDFSAYNGVSSNSIARINSDGSIDATFNPGNGASPIIHAVAIQSTGKIIIGGEFSSYNGSARNNIARISVAPANATCSVCPLQWTWRHGDNYADASAVYGTLGTFSASNKPSARSGALTWKDASGYFWLYGGQSSNSSQYYSDLWRYNPNTNQWAHMSGSTNTNAAPSYSAPGQASLSNTPGARAYGVSWIDASGNLWLFGGIQHLTPYNDLWKYSPATKMWTFVKGSTTPDQLGVYGSSTPSENNPGARHFASGWKDASGNLWLFGGYGNSATTRGVFLNDVWKYTASTNTWTFMKGSKNGNQKGVYGALGIAAAANNPGSRSGTSSWTDTKGNFWIYGGMGYAAVDGGPGSYLSDLWRYSPSTNQWTWIKGAVLVNQAPNYPASAGTATSSTNPGGRNFSTSLTDDSGNFYLFGGATAGNLFRNDLWRYSTATNQWTWVSGSNSTNQYGTYGVQGIGTEGTTPGARVWAAGWINADKLFICGGRGYAEATFGVLNDLWTYQIRATQSISFNSLTAKSVTAPDFIAGAYASSGLPVSYTSSNPAVAVVKNGVVHVLSAGTTTITASQSGNTYYFAATPVSRTLTVNKRSQVITFSTVPAKTFGNAPFTITATASSGLPVTYKSSNTSVATVNSTTGLVTIVAAGNVVITASQKGDSIYNVASANKTITIAPLATTINFPAIPSKTYGNAAFAPGATSTSPMPITYSSSNTGIITISSGMAIINAPGTVTITATQKAGLNYAAASVSRTVTVYKANQVISFAALASQTVGSLVPLNASAPGGTIIYTSSNVTVAEIMPGGILNCKLPGTVTITARQLGNAFYNSAIKTVTVTVVGDFSKEPITINNPISEIPVAPEKATIFPNPVSRLTNISFSSVAPGKAVIIIADASGKTVMQLHEQVNEGMNNIRFDASALKSGSYFMLIKSNSQTFKLSFVKLQ